ncbi:UDP-N-acetylmuramate dehydrogenase [Fructilactobacillus cliffordii]|uniref:UDP-N-acetylenolpyruvoylglucosamine reductase n=1 Tax=Fructilactobacillus cliffordii TaxID=2940299 RepID=A0A9Q8ZRV9_9LACO|nr:UDP-N-acetylmuramate dehydrogenase [Fructilactobacillus cliffordii]USS88663.1 UDP-N-acetylmuramate dehydrogenase [Fructilactobacillus cliffordii]
MTVDLTTKFTDFKILKDEPLAHYSWTKTGGPADFLAFPESDQQVEALVQYADQIDMPITVLGNASNLIVRDGGIRGLTIILTAMNHIHVDGERVIAEAGAAYIETTKVAQQAGLTGLEFAAGIPGSIGGGVFMNAGAYGGETKFVLESATVLTQELAVEVWPHEQLNFGYRHSAIQDQHAIVLGATFKLRLGHKDLIQHEMNHLNYLRKSKQPLEYPSCGSVFKRPKGHFAGKLIHEAGLQGYRAGGAEVSKKHAGFIVNVDHATATDYLHVIHHVQETVFAQTGIHLETEVRIIGVEP